MTHEGEPTPGVEPERSRPADAAFAEDHPPEGSLADRAVDLLAAVGLGIRDTARDMLEAGRKGAREAHDEYWRRFEAKTKLRREQAPPARSKGKRKKRR